MTDKGPKPSRRQSHMRLWRMPAMMLAVLLLIGAFAACSGGEDPSPRPEGPTSQRETEARDATNGSAAAGTTGDTQANHDGDTAEKVGDSMPNPEGSGDTGAMEMEYTSVSAGTFYTCGVRRDGSVACWGQDELSQATPPTGEFASVSAGSAHTCGVRRDGSVACWDNDKTG